MDTRIDAWINRFDACGNDKQAARAAIEEITELAEQAGLTQELRRELRNRMDSAAVDYGTARADFAMRFGPLPEDE